MLLFTVNTVFAAIFLLAARGALRRALPFLRAGWSAIRTETQKPDYRVNITSRRVISEGGRFLLGGLVWLGIALGSAAYGLLFAWRALAG